MSGLAPMQTSGVFAHSDLFHLTVAQYHEMMDAGILTTDDRVELIEGVLVKKMSIYPPHTGTVRTLRETLVPLLPPGWRYRSEQPIILQDSEPEPDGVIARGTPADDYVFHPPGVDVALVVEVADSTVSRDRGPKLHMYARAGIPMYWIVNLIDRQIEVHTNPDATAEEPVYRSRVVYSPTQLVDVMIAGQAITSISVESLLPPV